MRIAVPPKHSALIYSCTFNQTANGQANINKNFIA
jgi:hypothetical protein